VPGVSDLLAALPTVAREAIAARLAGREPQPPASATGELARRAPVFVTLKIAGELRGCMGELVARHEDLVAETVDRAVVAALGDPRFPPLTVDELSRCTIDVTILDPLEPIDSPERLDPARYGVEVSDSLGRRGVLLPGIEGIETVAQQIDIARRKAGIPENAEFALRRFLATRIDE